jgi:hypothetical protein
MLLHKGVVRPSYPCLGSSPTDTQLLVRQANMHIIQGLDMSVAAATIGLAFGSLLLPGRVCPLHAGLAVAPILWLYNTWVECTC